MSTTAAHPPGQRRKVVLYNPASVFYTMPLALIALGSALDRSRFDVRIVDARLERDPIGRLRAETRDALVLGITVLTGDPIRDALRASREVKESRPDLPVVWGGWHPSLFPQQTLDEKSVNVTVQGQGELTFRELVERFAAGKGLRDLQGIHYRDADGCSVANAPRPLASMDDLPEHDYGLVSVERYFELKNRRQLDYISSTGCPFRCTFCADPFVYGRKWTALSPARMGREIETLWRRHRFVEIAFQDETFFVYPDRVAEIAQELLSRQIRCSWTATLRADQAVRMSAEIFALCVRSGMSRVMVGVESGSQEMLDWMKKDLKIEQVLETASLCVDHEVRAIFPFIVGFPGESDESVRETVALVKRLRSMSPRFETPIFYFKPYPGSEITARVIEAGFELPSSLEQWADFDFIGSAGPWVSPEKHRWMERFKFYNRFAWGPETWPRKPLQKIARWRCRRDFYSLPIERSLVERFRPQPRLS